VAPSLGVELTAVNAQDAGEIERAVTEFARAPNSGLIVTGGRTDRLASRADCGARGTA